MTRNGGGGRLDPVDRLVVGEPDATGFCAVAVGTRDESLRSDSGLGDRLSPRPRMTTESLVPLQLLPQLPPPQGGDCCWNVVVELVLAVEFSVTID